MKILEQALQYLEIGLPIYQIQMFQKASPIVKYTKINQKTCKLVRATEKY